MAFNWGKKSETETTPSVEQAEAKPNLFGRLFTGLAKSSSKLADGVAAVFVKKKLDTETLDELQDTLVLADVGPPAAARIRAGISQGRFDKEIGDDELKQALADEIASILKPREPRDDPFTAQPDSKPGPRVILFVGVNGSGKTTTIGKLAARLKASGKSVMMAAGDTFRAAAIEQLKVWGERTNSPVISGVTGGDAAGLAYEALERARSTGTDVLLIDTAGRLQNKSELMSELAKIVRALGKIDDEAPHEVWIVLDATVGQNALSQAEAFRSAAGITGLIMTKLDGTAKGGVLVALADKHALPIRFIGVGEAAEDLQPFSAQAFARALVGLEAA
jgi:fused signal recognition particle receptor